ncbi:MAG: UbiA family prenyltransferase [Gemmatimonadaceae bacterium]
MLVGAWWAGGSTRTVPVGLAALAAVALTAFANAYNDYRDVGIDRVAHPARPLPSGRLSLRAARYTALAAAAGALVLSAGAHPALLPVSWAVVVLMWAYSRRIKATGVPGNLVVALLASLPFLYGAIVAGRPARGWVLVALAAPLHLAREIAKDMDDAPGDAGVRRTLPVARGAAAARWALVAALVLFAAALLPLALRRPLFALCMAPGLGLCIAAARRVLSGRPGGALLFKTAMLASMAALVVAFRR